MSIKEKAQQLTMTTKWKADQQLRILDLNNKISDLERQVRMAKSQLADQTLVAFFKQELTHEQLNELCKSIEQLFKNIEQLNKDRENAKNERPPEVIYSEYAPDTTSSGLICPVCSTPLRGKFCPVHGVEGIAPGAPSNTPVEQKENVAGRLVCPKCGRDLAGSFCPVDGSRGVPKDIHPEINTDTE